MTEYSAHVCFEAFKEYYAAKKVLEVAEHKMAQLKQCMPQISEKTLVTELAKAVDASIVPHQNPEHLLIQYAASQRQNEMAQAAINAAKEVVNQSKEKWDNELKTLIASS